jgi:dynein heavy chain, axonemal
MQFKFFFKELCNDIQRDLNVITCTSHPNLYEKLESLQERLSLCEKTLAEYLETKRLAFPR